MPLLCPALWIAGPTTPAEDGFWRSEEHQDHDVDFCGVFFEGQEFTVNDWVVFWFCPENGNER